MRLCVNWGSWGLYGALVPGERMTWTDFKTVDEYIATFPEDVRQILQTVRSTIREAVPEAEKYIGYQLPAYRYHGPLIYFGGFAKHWSLFGHSDTVLAAFRDELSGHEISKGTIKFPLDEPVPIDLVRKIAAFRSAENLDRAQTKRPQKRDRE